MEVFFTKREANGWKRRKPRTARQATAIAKARALAAIAAAKISSKARASSNKSIRCKNYSCNSKEHQQEEQQQKQVVGIIYFHSSG
jgi:hypothetical protein